MHVAALVLAWVLIVAGFLVLLLPGPAGWPGLVLLVPGLLLLMRRSRPARKWFVQAARQDPRVFGRVRRWVGRRRPDGRAGSDAGPGAGG